MNGANRPWPPLIVARHVPGPVKWRDLLLTSFMWAIFVVLVEAEFELFVDDFLEWLGYGRRGGSDANWSAYVERLMPFLLVAAALAGFLVTFSLRTLRRSFRARFLPQPAPLDAAVEARRTGLDEAALIAARARRIVIVHIDADGRHRIEAP
jgi:hypothetical protein